MELVRATSMDERFLRCSRLDQKPFYPIFKLAGFTGFDGEFEE